MAAGTREKQKKERNTKASDRETESECAREREKKRGKRETENKRRGTLNVRHSPARSCSFATASSALFPIKARGLEEAEVGVRGAPARVEAGEE